MPQTLPLEGIKVIELGSSISGPSSTEALGSLGADVIKVEPPEGDATRGWGSKLDWGSAVGYECTNREKRGVTVDFSNPEQLDQLKELIGSADVVLQNFRKGVVDKFGIGPEPMLKKNPRLVYCNVNAYGEGPMSDRPGYDPLVQAFTGIMSVTGEEHRPPSRVGVSLIDLGTGMWATIGILSALLRRQSTGIGGVVDASLLDTALNWMKLPITEYVASGTMPRRLGNRGPALIPNQGFETADGVLMVTAGTDGQFKNFCDVLNRPEWAKDERFAKNIPRNINGEILLEKIIEVMKEHPRSYWIERFDALNIPNSPVQTIDEVVKHPQVIASKMIQQNPDSPLELVGIPIKFDGERPGFNRRPPQLGQHNAEIFNKKNDEGKN